jgi:hypothetical protein
MQRKNVRPEDGEVLMLMTNNIVEFHCQVILLMKPMKLSCRNIDIRFPVVVHSQQAAIQGGQVTVKQKIDFGRSWSCS